MWHGSLEFDGFRRAWLAGVADAVGVSWTPTESPGFAARRESMIETVADALEAHADLDALLGLAR